MIDDYDFSGFPEMGSSVALMESTIINKKDIMWNMDKFHNGEVNLCFITGHGGSGKSTLAREIGKKENASVIELDDVIWNKMKFTMDEYKEYDDMLYSFFSTVGKKFYLDKGEKYTAGKSEDYETDAIHAFIDYAKKYASQHKNKKYILEGVWLAYNNIAPESLKDYAVIIKGTSSVTSTLRGIKRDHNDDASSKFNRIKRDVKALKKRSTHWKSNEKYMKVYRDFYSRLIKTTK